MLLQSQSKPAVMFIHVSWNFLLLFVALGLFNSGLVSGEPPETCDVSKSSSSSTLRNSAFVFIKSHANTQATRDLVQEKLTKAGISILSELAIDGATIDTKGYIDQHYYSIASKATILSADKIPVPPEKFEASFGESWKNVLKEKRACNAMEACQRFECSPDELNAVWQKAEAIKFGGGFYCAKISVNGKPELYVFNAFFMAMRAKFVGENYIHCYVVEWDPSILSWSAFRNKVLGPTDPKEAPKGSIRRTILDRYQKLGLNSVPNKGDNGVHASASPFEGLAERSNWLGNKVDEDSFGKALIDVGISESKILAWFKDPQITIDSSANSGSVFDQLEDMDVQECLLKLAELNKLNKQ